MDSLPVHWADGMFLLPHHFQAADRFWAHQSRTSREWTHSYDYGFYRLVLDPIAIQNQQVRFTDCRARMPDGTLVELTAAPDIAPSDFADAAGALKKGSDSIDVLLAVPDAGSRRNLSASFEPVETEVPDENEEGKADTIFLRRLNVKLLLSPHQDALRTGRSCLTLGRIVRNGSSLAWDADYIPPLLDSNGSSLFHQRYVNDVVQQLKRTGDAIATEVKSLRTSPVTWNGVVQMNKLFALNWVYGHLSALESGRVVHPFPVFIALRSLVAGLTTFTPDRTGLALPEYDHDRLEGCFSRLINILTDALRSEGSRSSSGSSIRSGTGGSIRTSGESSRAEGD